MSRSEVIAKNNTMNRSLAPLTTFGDEIDKIKSRKVSECEKSKEFEYKGYYKFGRILGKGSFGTVVECFRKADGRPVALKLFQYKAIHKWYPESMVGEYMDHDLVKLSEFFSQNGHDEWRRRHRQEINGIGEQEHDNSKDRQLPSEVACLLRAHNIPGVIKILDYIPADETAASACNANEERVGGDGDGAADKDDDALIGIVLERDPTEECLFDYLVRRNTVTESEARVIMRQLVQVSVELLHRGIFHGDLKSENILISPSSMQIKVIDFGSAQILSADNGHHNHSSSNRHHHHHQSSSNNKCNSQSMVGKLVRTFRGTNLYKPPEFILHRCFYPRPSTVWTLGIILFDLVCGRFPFDKDTDVLTHQDKEIDFGEHTSKLSEGIKDLIRRCLAFYVADRIVIEKVLIHPWLNVAD